MALHPNFPDSPHAILAPELRWFPAEEALRETGSEKLMLPLVAKIRRQVKAFRDAGYDGASPTSRSLLNWWFKEPHLMPQADGSAAEFRYFFAQQETVETIVYLYDAARVKDNYDLMRFDSSGAVSTAMFDETWRRFVVKMATGSGKTKVLSLVLAWFKSIEDVHNRLVQKGSSLSLQLDVTATPKHNNGAVFVQTVSDYPLVEAISQNVVKHPVLPDAPSRAKLVERQSAKYTEKYADYID